MIKITVDRQLSFIKNETARTFLVNTDYPGIFTITTPDGKFKQNLKASEYRQLVKASSGEKKVPEQQEDPAQGQQGSAGDQGGDQDPAKEFDAEARQKELTKMNRTQVVAEAARYDIGAVDENGKDIKKATLIDEIIEVESQANAPIQ